MSITYPYSIEQKQVALLAKEKEDIEHELGVLKAKLRIIELRENFTKNKAEKLIVQKDFLVKQIDNNIEAMNGEYNKLQDLEGQKDFMISVKKSNKNMQEIYLSSINNLKYFKEVIDFMNFQEFKSVNQILVSDNVDDQREKEKLGHSKSHTTSFVSDIKEESYDKLNEDSGFLEKGVLQKKSETSLINKIDIGKSKARRHTTSQNLVRDVKLEEQEQLEGDKPEDLFNTTDQQVFKKDVEFYFTHYWQELLNAVTTILCTFYEVSAREVNLMWYRELT